MDAETKFANHRGVNQTLRLDSDSASTSPSLSDDCYRRFFENGVDGLYRTSPDGRLLLANQALADLAGYGSSGEMIADVQDVARQFYTNPAERVRFQNALQTTGAVRNFETEMRRRDGSVIWISADARSLRDEGGNVYFEGMIRDVTLQRNQQHELKRLTRLYAALSQINQAIVMTPERAALYAKICQALVEFGGFKMAWVGRVDRQTLKVIPVGRWGDQFDYLATIDVSVDERPEGHGPTGTVIREGRAYICNDSLNDPQTLPWRAQAARSGFRSSATFPIRDGGEVCAALCVYSDELGFFQDKEVALLEEVADDVSFALDSLGREEARRKAEASLRERDEQFKAFFERANVGMSITDLFGRNTQGNQALADMLGLTPVELGQTTWQAVTHPDDVQETQRRIDELISGRQQSIRLTKRFRHKNGSVVWADLSSTLRRDAIGHPHYIMSTIVDITERHRAHEALRTSEQRLRAIIESSPVPMGLNDEQQRITFLNSAFISTFGYAKDDLQTLSQWWPLAYPDPAYRGWVAETWQAELERSKRAGLPFSPIEVNIRCKDGTNRTVLASAASIADKFEGDHLVVLYDITERKHSENTLLLRGAALEAAANAIVITDLQGAIEWANPAFTQLSGWELSEALGKNPRDLVKSDKHDAAFFRQMWNTIRAGNVWQGEIINCRKDGELRTENMAITPVRDQQGKISHYVAIKQDITRQKAIEEHLLQTQRIEAIGTLASGVAHDLNNILSPILLVAGVLKDAQRDTSNREMLAMVQTSAARGSEIVKQLLTFSRGQTGARAPVQLRHLLKEIAIVVRETFPRNIELHHDLRNDMWTVTADPTQLHQVLLNLCVNARDAMPNGGHLTLSATNVTLDEKAPALAPGAHPGPYLAVVVRDTGQGIPPEMRHRIFDPFFTTKPLGAGTGLGLSTVLGVVQSHGGFVTVDSAPGLGTTFTVYFPAMAEGNHALPVETAVAIERVGPAPSRHMILVVDDEPNVVRASRILLERHGYRVISAVNGQDGLIQYIQNRAQVRLVLSDLMMPVMNGIDLARALRALDPTLRIVITSGLNDIVPTPILAELGIGEVLKKPCDPDLLIATVHQHLTSVGIERPVV